MAAARQPDAGRRPARVLVRGAHAHGARRAARRRALCGFSLIISERFHGGRFWQCTMDSTHEAQRKECQVAWLLNFVRFFSGGSIYEM